MNIHKKHKPTIVINFDKTIKKSKNKKSNKKIKLFLNSLKKHFRIIIYAPKHFHSALEWIMKNNLDQNCIFKLTTEKTNCFMLIEKIEQYLNKK